MTPALLVADAGPLIALARIGGLPWLPALFTTVVIPRPVWTECTAAAGKPGAQAISVLAETPGFVIEDPETEAPLDEGPPRLGPGGTAAIQLAAARRAWVLLDDQLARRYARQQGLPVIGILGLLKAAQRAGLIPALQPPLLALAATGYRLSRVPIEATLADSGESSDPDRS
jgi:predicted nucleic acid-binding protein